MARTYAAVDPSRLPDVLAADLAAVGVPGRALRVALDGPRSANPHTLADALVEPLRARSRDVARVRAEMFWRDASVRLEHGRHDVRAFGHDWLDADALRREVLVPLGPGGDGDYLPSLRDPVTNRATRAPRRPARTGTILVVSGELLLGAELPFDRTIHLAVTAAGRARRMPEEWAWTLPAFETYDHDVDPIGNADVVVRLDDPRHPAISGATSDPRASRR
jgi:hypothetical protein